MNPSVSIIIPTFNRAELLKEALKSCTQQTYNNLQIIIIDDNSSEDIKEVVSAQLEGFNYKYFKNTSNGGPSLCRNIGIGMADGEYISFLDSDDSIKENKIELLIKEALNTDADYIYGGWIWKDFNNNRMRIARIPDRKTGLIDNHPRWCYNIVPDLVKENIMRENLFDPTVKSYELFDFGIRMFKKYKTAFVPEVISVFRDHTGPRNSSNKAAMIEAIELLFKEHKDFISKEKDFASKLRLTQGIFYNELHKKKKLSFFLKAINMDPSNWRVYYHIIKAVV